MNQPTLQSLRPCLEGILPAVIATVAEDGTPNVTYLSKVWYVDETHVALSNQFFNKTLANLRRNPKIQLLLMNPPDGQHYRLDVEYLRTDYAGEMFDRMSAEIDALASVFGMQGVFKLRSLEVCRVHRIEGVPCELASTS
ncbi:MAG TPA: pyridoxamine 5'-phosphate oxidase family protein [Polyangiaceae bacterium]|jgi:predicted pyridoxine 5'-phosphate oxidase superfamily flavin-nucleotide-binding protein|nr:pyridoxamine 5'-phosphate oxidase family protein [Polyangiaceae bacterium]